MGTGLLLFLVGMLGAFFVSSDLDYWLTVGGWIVGVIGSVLYGYRFAKRLVGKRGGMKLF